MEAGYAADAPPVAGSLPTPSQARENSQLQLIGLVLALAGLGLLGVAANELLNTIPPRYGTAFNILFAGGLGFVLTFTGLYYYVVARNDVGLLLTPDALSISEDPETGAREWIKFDHVVRMHVRPWLMSPWLNGARFAELEVEAKQGDVPVNDTFVLRLPDDGGEFVKRLKEALGNRIELVGPYAKL